MAHFKKWSVSVLQVTKLLLVMQNAKRPHLGLSQPLRICRIPPIEMHANFGHSLFKLSFFDKSKNLLLIFRFFDEHGFRRLIFERRLT